MQNQCNGMTLAEIMVVISIIALAATFALPVIYQEQEYQDVASAINTAQQLATAIEYGRSIQQADLFDGTLNEFIVSHNGRIDRYMSTVDDDFTVVGRNPGSLFRVVVNQFSVYVSFSLTGSEYSDFNFPSARKEILVDEVDEEEVTTVRWTVGPSAGSGLAIAYGVNHYINAD